MVWKRPVSSADLFVTIIHANCMKFDLLWFDRSKLRKVRLLFQLPNLNGRTYTILGKKIVKLCDVVTCQI